MKSEFRSDVSEGSLGFTCEVQFPWNLLALEIMAHAKFDSMRSHQAGT
jgi:hypothetical protein